jgi:hypothetical protein
VGPQGAGVPPALGSEVIRIPSRPGVERLEPHAHGGARSLSAALGGFPRGPPFSVFGAPSTLFGAALGLAAASQMVALAGPDAGSSRGGVSPNAPPQLPAPSGGSGSSGGPGLGSSTLFALLVSLAAFSAQRFSRRLDLALAPWRPTAFIAVIERPG